MPEKHATTSVAVQVVVRNGAPTIVPCISAVLNQTYCSLEIRVLDNASDDGTAAIIQNHFPHIPIIRNSLNVGMWRGQEQLLASSSTPYVLALSCDVVLDFNFVEAGVRLLERDARVGAVQCKMLRRSQSVTGPQHIDSCGFRIFRSRRIVNIGQGEIDRGQYDVAAEVFGVEGAAPLFRRAALDAATLGGELADPLFFWYGDDLDIAWRLRLLGWKQMYNPLMIAWHHRLTSDSLSKGLLDSVRRRHFRRSVPLRRRQLDWCNVRLARVKNEHMINVFVDLPRILWREITVLLYSVFFEPGVLLALPRFVRRLPASLRKRRAVGAATVISASAIREWFGHDFRESV